LIVGRGESEKANDAKYPAPASTAQVPLSNAPGENFEKLLPPSPARETAAHIMMAIAIQYIFKPILCFCVGYTQQGDWREGLFGLTVDDAGPGMDKGLPARKCTKRPLVRDEGFEPAGPLLGVKPL
jgi:hypothetical protein